MVQSTTRLMELLRRLLHMSYYQMRMIMKNYNHTFQINLQKKDVYPFKIHHLFEMCGCKFYYTTYIL
jgi:hypothetical protein